MKKLTNEFMLRVRIGVSFVNKLLDSMITSFMAIHLVVAFGAGVAGALMFVAVSCGVVAMLVGGHLADVRGRRRTLLYAEGGISVAYAAMAVAQVNGSEGDIPLYIAYVLNRIATSISLPASDALIIDVTTPQTRKRAYTINYWAVNLALALGALLGAWLYNGHFIVMLVIGSTCTVGVWLTTLLLIRETHRTVSQPRTRSAWREFAAAYPIVLRNQRFLRLMIAGTLGLCIEFQLINYIGVRLATHVSRQDLVAIHSFILRTTGTQMLGILRAENTILVVLMALFATRLFGRMPDHARLYIGIVVFVGGYMILAVSNTGWVLMLATLVFTVGELMNVPIKQAMLADLVPEKDRSRYMAIYNISVGAAQMIATLFIALGAVLAPAGIAVCYGIIGIIIVLTYRSILNTSAT